MAKKLLLFIYVEIASQLGLRNSALKANTRSRKLKGIRCVYVDDVHVHLLRVSKAFRAKQLTCQRQSCGRVAFDIGIAPNADDAR